MDIKSAQPPPRLDFAIAITLEARSTAVLV